MTFESFLKAVEEFAKKNNLQIEGVNNFSPSEFANLYIADLKDGLKLSFIKGFCKEFSCYQEGKVIVPSSVLGQGTNLEEAYLDFQNQIASLTST